MAGKFFDLTLLTGFGSGLLERGGVFFLMGDADFRERRVSESVDFRSEDEDSESELLESEPEFSLLEDEVDDDEDEELEDDDSELVPPSCKREK